VKVIDEATGSPIVSVDREQFRDAGGLWADSGTPDRSEPRIKRDVWDVVVTHPVAIGRPLKWGFTRDGLPFRAKVTDPNFLLAIRQRRLPLQIHEGALLRVEIEWRELPDNGVWTPDKKSYEVIRVLWPTPLPGDQPLPLFAPGEDASNKQDQDGASDRGR
jgi:hypothetical protein